MRDRGAQRQTLKLLSPTLSHLNTLPGSQGLSTRRREPGLAERSCTASCCDICLLPYLKHSPIERKQALSIFKGGQRGTWTEGLLQQWQP